ncbi:unnamed protein product [Coffea canephora]|uniref:Uncharacterized protein n=1 Tax=Coffea canephora TaxID=49390 RepID=A0A068TQT7_COFCA|nr:unnamed protein product [Coffea canephora]
MIEMMLYKYYMIHELVETRVYFTALVLFLL